MSGFARRGLEGASPQDLSWLVGSWHGRLGDGESIEEHWSPLRGNTLMGMFRWVEGDRVRFYEIETIEREGEHLIMRVKHFDPGLVGWEEKDAPHEFLLVELDEQGAVFFEHDKPEPRWVVYRRRGSNHLSVYFTRDVEPERDPGVFELTRE